MEKTLLDFSSEQKISSSCFTSKSIFSEDWIRAGDFHRKFISTLSLHRRKNFLCSVYFEYLPKVARNLVLQSFQDRAQLFPKDLYFQHEKHIQKGAAQKQVPCWEPFFYAKYFPISWTIFTRNVHWMGFNDGLSKSDMISQGLERISFYFLR